MDFDSDTSIKFDVGSGFIVLKWMVDLGGDMCSF